MKRIIVAGGTSGIGLKTVELLAESGAMVGVAGRNTAALEELAARYPGRIVCERIDVTDTDAPRLLRRLADRTGGMDCYLHVAGIGFENENLDAEKELRTLDTNAMGFTRMIDEAYRYFRDVNGGTGHIAAITSVAGTNGLGLLASYSATKSYQQTYLRALSQLASMNGLKIKFTDIRPGWVRTPLLAKGEKYPLLMNPGYAARRVVRAIERGKRVAFIDWRWHIVCLLWRLIPDALWVRLPIRPGGLSGRG